MALVAAGEHQFNVDCIVFDKDGTLLDFDYTWGTRTANWIRALARQIPGENNLYEYFSKAIGYDWTNKRVQPDGPTAVTTAQKLVTLAAGALYQQGLPWHESEHLAVQTIHQEMGAPFKASEIRPVGNVMGTTLRLKDAGLLLAIATGDDRNPTESTLSLLGIASQISAVVCGDDPIPEKPDPAALFHIRDETGIPTKRMLMVGDTVNDMLTGRNAAVAGCIGITGSTGEPSMLAPYADAILTSIEELIVF
jgi:phosphoglycolate phosphatase-like HAD superfamily hydrolase